MLILVALVAVLLIGVGVGLALRGCVLLLGDRRQLDLTARRLRAEQEVTAVTRQTLAAIQQVAREQFRP